ncbi:MAG: hypothetical protein H6822_30175 [Planctomycetaceae bacterium]|nr:hypothetical protein [Planctomycetales bacterium]MCB9926451.1 hypothetical protein [Planctomycetaceae bacterium]
MRRKLIPIAIILIVIGCTNDSDRVAELASRHATQQAELSRETVKLQNELVEGTQKLVEADAQARRDFLELEGKLDEQRVEVGRRHDELEDERREIAKQRYRDPIVANALIAAATLLACLLPMLLAGWLLRSQLDETAEHTATEMLLEEITATRSGLVPPSAAALDHGSRGPAPRIGGDAKPPPPHEAS